MRSTIRTIVAAGLMAIGCVSAASAAPPSYYPEDYGKLIEAAKSETSLLIYSNIGATNWAPIIKAFNAEYPWIKVDTTDMRAPEVFERYYADNATGGKSADILLAAAPQNWMEFFPKNQVLDYVSPEASRVPDWSRPKPGIYTISMDPFVLAYNKLLLPEAEWPKSMADIVKLVEKSPGKYTNKIGTYAPNASTYTQGLYWAVTQRNGEKAYDWFKTLGPITEPYRATGPVLEKITTGEYLLGYFVVGLNIIPDVSDPVRAKVIGWALPNDAAAVYMRNFAITKTSKSPNAAKLMTDFLLSTAGQTQVGIGGLLPYRADVTDPAAFRLGGLSFAKLVESVGEKNLITIDFDQAMLTGTDAMAKRLDTIFKQPK